MTEKIKLKSCGLVTEIQNLVHLNDTAKVQLMPKLKKGVVLQKDRRM